VKSINAGANIYASQTGTELTLNAGKSSWVGGGTSLATIDNSGLLQRPTGDMELYMYIWQDPDGISDRLDNFFTGSTSAGSGTVNTRAMSGGLVNDINIPSLSNAGWKNMPVGDIVSAADSSGILTRSNWNVTIGTGGDGIYMVSYVATCSQDSAVAANYAFTIAKGLNKTGIYGRATLVNGTIIQVSMTGFVRVVASDVIGVQAISNASNTLWMYRQNYYLYRISRRTS
jgi:hypothetical protein